MGNTRKEYAIDLKFCMVILETHVHNICKIQTSSILLTVFIKMAYMAYRNVWENFENQYLYGQMIFFENFFTINFTFSARFKIIFLMLPIYNSNTLKNACPGIGGT